MHSRHVLKQLDKQIIVSCQADRGEPLDHPEHMAALALSAELGAAGGIRANGPRDIEAIRRRVSIPVIGIFKQHIEGCAVYITPTFESAQAVAKAGADIIAIDATGRPRPDGHTVETLIAAIQNELGLPVMADISTVDEALAASDAGADLIATTLGGYTPYSRMTDGPDFELLEAIARQVRIPVVLEGRVWTPEHVRQGFDRGARAIVIGTAITRPHIITQRFVAAVPAAQKMEPDVQ